MNYEPALIILAVTVALIIVSTNEYLRTKLFLSFATWLDGLFQNLDNWVNDKETTKKAGVFNTKGHSRAVSVLVIGVLIYTIYGPTWSPFTALFDPTLWRNPNYPMGWNVLALTFLVVLILILGFAQRLFYGRALQLFHLFLIVLAAAFVLFFPDNEIYIEASGLPYPHIFATLSLTFALAAYIISRFVSVFTINKFVEETDNSQTAREVLKYWCFEAPRPQHNKVPAALAFHAWIGLPLRYPILLLVIPSACVLFSATLFDANQTRDNNVFVIAFVLTLTALSASNGFESLRTSGTILQRRFARGGSLAISIALIILTCTYLLNVSYVTTVMQGMGWKIWNYILAAYLLVWLYDYWANRVATTKLLELFTKPDLKKEPDKTYPDIIQSTRNMVGFQDDWHHDYFRIDGKKASLRLHGRSRFVAYLIDDPTICSRPLLTNELFKELEKAAQMVSDEVKDGKSLSDRADNLRSAVHHLMKNYLVSLHFALLLVAIAVFMFANREEAIPMVSADRNSSSDKSESSSRALTTKADSCQSDLLCSLLQKHDEPVVLLAASGGGTRAALYTTSMLYGLHQVGLDRRIALVSGVSGGGVALAYFAAKRQQLQDSNVKAECVTKTPAYSKEISEIESPAWRCFFQAMSTSFISDVVEGIAEWRIVKGQPNGVLLAESLQRNFSKTAATISDLQDIGLILNTTIAGHSKHFSERLKSLWCDDRGCNNTNADFTVHAGGRLVFTNLRKDAFTNQPPNWPLDVLLKYQVINYGDVSIAKAAALNANFPPVFSDALVTIKSMPVNDNPAELQRYWVTDGGAADNRGIISLLLALKSTLGRWKALPTELQFELPKLHIVVAEASFLNQDYIRGGRGLPVLMGSSAPFASQLMRELHNEIKVLAGEELVEFHYIEMPRVFLTRGGQGTHWMLPPSITLTNPRVEERNQVVSERDTIELSKDQVLSIAVHLHGKKDELCMTNLPIELRETLASDHHELLETGSDEDIKQEVEKDNPLKWICDESHQDAWQKLLTALLP